MDRKSKIIASALALAILIPNVAHASNKVEATKENSTFNYIEEDGKYKIIEPVEKKVLHRKGFRYDSQLDRFVDVNYVSDIILTDIEMEAVNDWAAGVYELSGAAYQNTDKAKARNIATYLKSAFLYDRDTRDSDNFNVASQIRSLPFRGRAMCKGFTLALVRVLDVAGIESYAASCTSGGVFHSVVRAYLDGQWTTIEATGYGEHYNLMDDMINGKDIEEDVFPTDQTFLKPGSDLKQDYGTKYNIAIDQEIEDFLANNDFVIYGY